MYDFVTSSLGWFHLATALMAMFSGALVLAKRKGRSVIEKSIYTTTVIVTGSIFNRKNLHPEKFCTKLFINQ